ncbi:MAG: glycoside hydrolase family 95 protein [Tannerella sp.]|jgi:alpha-L-fucosidase 2|nr:glycoside hydrolase family 95 protein [Tannerella sp.]
MKTVLQISFLIIICTLIGCGNKQQANLLKLRYDRPAKVWEEALPLGNGYIGAMVYGNPINEYYQLNENTLWSGAPREGNNPEAVAALPGIRKAIDAGDYIKAAELWRENTQGYYSARYLPMANLFLDMSVVDTAFSSFYRDLNISEATSTVKFLTSSP